MRAPLPQDGFGGGFAGQIAELAGIGGEIEELLGGIASVEDVLVMAIGAAVPVIVGTVADAVLEIEITTPFRGFSGGERQQAAAVERAL